MGRRSAFTLVELMVTASMLALLGGAGSAALSAGIRASQKARHLGRMTANAQRALNVIATDLRAAVVHDETALTALDAQYEGLNSDTVDVIAPRSLYAAPEPGSGARCEIGYYIDNDPDTDLAWLVRRVDNVLDDDEFAGGDLSMVAPFVAELDLAFWDGMDWLSDWQDEDSLPRAVRIGIVVVDPDDAETPLYFETSVSLPTR